MDAVILAAGHGYRLRPQFASKPLARVGGTSLLEHSIRQASKAGADRCVIVTGYKGKAVEAALDDIRERVDARIEAVRVDNFDRPNGFSVIAGAGVCEGDFLLLMADHLLCDDILRPLAASKLHNDDALLAIDRRLDNPLIDPLDATFVRTGPHGKILAIGKTIAPYDAVDCGAFLANRKLTDAIAEAIADGRAGSLSDGMQLLADRQRAATLDIGDAWWIDVDDGRAHALAQEQAAAHLGAIDSRAASQ